MPPLSVELTEHGSLYLSAAIAEAYFPNDALVALPKERELWLLPVRGDGGGGLLLKRKNAAGDRAVIIWEALPRDIESGPLAAFWDDRQGALRVAVNPALNVPPGDAP